MTSTDATIKTNYYFRVLAALVTLAMAASLLVMVARPAEAAFPGENGNIVYSSDRDGDREIYRTSMCIICNNKLTNNSAKDTVPAVSPDGTKIAFTSDRDGNFEVYAMNPHGDNQTNLTNNPEGNDGGEGGLDFSPDGKKIAFTSDRGFTGWEVYIMDSGGTNQTNLTNFGSANYPVNDYHPAFSPDGKKIAFARVAEVYVMDRDGANQTNLTNHAGYDTHPDWGPRPS